MAASLLAWRRVRALCVKETRQIVRDPSSWLIAVVIPLLLLFIFGYGINLDSSRLRVGDPTDPNTQVGSLISQQHWEKVSGYIRLGIEEGATLLAGGPDKPADLPAHLKGGHFLRPTVLADVDNRMRVAQEEIFGPVACLLPFKDEAEGLRLANDVEYGLASYIWTQDVSKVLRLARGIEAGMVFVNTQNVRDLRQPFGGVKASGTGREGGEYSFEVFAEMKNVCISMGDHPIPKWGV